MNGEQPPPLRRVLHLFFSLDRMRRCYRSRPILDPDSSSGFARKHNINDVPDECGLRERDQHRRKRYLQAGKRDLQRRNLCRSSCIGVRPS